MKTNGQLVAFDYFKNFRKNFLFPNKVLFRNLNTLAFTMPVSSVDVETYVESIANLSVLSRIMDFQFYLRLPECKKATF